MIYPCLLPDQQSNQWHLFTFLLSNPLNQNMVSIFIFSPGLCFPIFHQFSVLTTGVKLQQSVFPVSKSHGVVMPTLSSSVGGLTDNRHKLLQELHVCTGQRLSCQASAFGSGAPIYIFFSEIMFLSFAHFPTGFLVS